MSSSSSRVDDHSGFTFTGYCDCDSGFYEATYIEWTTHSMGMLGRATWNVVRGLAAVATLGLSTVVNGGLKSFTHEAIRMFIHCTQCGRNMSLTSELSSKGKMRRWGYYSLYLTRKESCDLTRRIPYKTVSEKFCGMWNSYNLIDGNCAFWASDYYSRIRNA